VAIPANLMESELFGFEKGAFTGAAGMKHGLFELAHEGTLFLDEISELEINLQAKLLRVLQERQFRRLGGERLISVDMRVIAAMNQRPAKAMSEGNLRKDLFYRLNIIPLHVPALRHRAEDIPALVEHFLEKAVKKNHLRAKNFSPEALALLQNYHWPGNVRQLQNLVERLAVLSPSEVIGAQDLPAKYRAARNSPNTQLPFNEAKKRHLAAFEKEYFTKLLAETNFNITQAARIAGISDRTVYRMLQRYGSLRTKASLKS
jgi:transcriptional regulator with PAS, ATPase and Fis domain